jgi:hypothetical protein
VARTRADLAECSSKRVQEGNQVLLLLLSQIHLETLIVEIDELVQICGRTVVKIVRARGESAENRTVAPIEVTAQSRDQRLAGIGCIEGFLLSGIEGIGTAVDSDRPADRARRVGRARPQFFLIAHDAITSVFATLAKSRESVLPHS